MKRIAILGAFGGGNCGDEAMLHIHYNMLKDFGNITLITGSQIDNSKKGIFPYKYCDISSTSDKMAAVKANVDALVIGGGNIFGLGFTQATMAIRKGIPIYYSGVGLSGECHHPTNKNFNSLVSSMLGSFEEILVRDKRSLEHARKIGVENITSVIPDWAWLLKPAERINHTLPPVEYVVVCFRNSGQKSRDLQELHNLIIELYDSLRAQGLSMVVLPFNRADQKRAYEIKSNIEKERNSSNLHIIPDLYWEPEKVMHVIDKSKMVVSDGRFHPIVFSAACVKPFIIFNSRLKKPADDKMHRFCIDNGFDEFYQVGQPFSSLTGSILQCLKIDPLVLEEVRECNINAANNAREYFIEKVLG